LTEREVGGQVVLIALDVDGTLDTAYGPVPFASMRSLAEAGVPVAVVSPSSGWPGGLPTFIAGPTRADNLRAARSLAPDATVRLYVSDNKDNVEAQLAGFALIEPQDFAAMLGGA
jgi:hypothetical protein